MVVCPSLRTTALSHPGLFVILSPMSKVFYGDRIPRKTLVTFENCQVIFFSNVILDLPQKVRFRLSKSSINGRRSLFFHNLVFM
jgi:hypothetical protein